MSRLVDFLKADWTRLGAGIAMLVALLTVGVTQGAYDDWSATSGLALMTAGIAFVTWLSAEIASHERDLCDHDLELYGNIRERFTEERMFFLRRHEFAEPFDHEMTSPLVDVTVNWNGARYQFEDPQLDATWLALRNELAEFVEHLGGKLHAERENGERTGRLVLDASLTKSFDRDRYDADREALNASATKVVSALDELDRKIRPMRKRAQ